MPARGAQSRAIIPDGAIMPPRNLLNAALLLSLSAPAVAFRFHRLPVQPHVHLARSPAVRCAADPDADSPPRDLNKVCDGARVSLREALLAGQRTLTVEASMAALDPTSRGYDP